ncbi:alpha/beta fold hydrolase [Rhizobium ruizarguesonis]|jgi:pimeloyl-ACP methyl ester carboxylesterase|uniref:Alpha/beta hydrolase n=1 Tax=Rhizobium ruizarguesonis TaxID=2081791 RepID=A0AB38I5S1_9HYPH|nr:alpha/beta hydrolase [Rhizobium ruizarguesonis]NEI10106.1 alpha/beta fold hydrolase [Rhizobium ruizarguesonis]NEI29779.1 alpha/beta fold hydrolase [Rhizobium ruizarguesonis]TAY94073.1 alpha/beta hydrolase [Rhizobium ruizarguesonis]TAZ78472.1 alpha/beta hydrolase [Rhizobium ruizarguesonis]TBA04850.1 alpha/beta hydrolase [Rhizobium ruizarguesonis]
MSKDKTVSAASVAATSPSHTAEAFASTQAAQDAVDFIEIDEVLTLRRMIVRAPAQKGTVLFLHGFPETLMVWKGIATTLARDYDVHAFDWPGYGQSSRPAWERFSYAPRAYAQVLKAYIERAGIDRSNLVIYATDIAALPVLLLALDEPTIARQIIVGDFAPFDRPQYMWENLQNLKAEPTASPTRAYMNKTSDEILENVHRRGLSPAEQFDLPIDVQQDMTRSWSLDGMTSADAFAHYYANFTRDQHHLEANLTRLKTPVKVIWGEKDLYITSEMGIEFAGKIGAKLDVLPGIGHFPHLQKPEKTVEEINASFG